MKTINEIKQAIPNPSEKITLLAGEYDRIRDLKILTSSDGGKDLIEVLRGNCTTALYKLISIAKAEKPELITLLSIIMDYSASMTLLTKLQDITDLQEIDRQLEDAVKEYSQ